MLQEDSPEMGQRGRALLLARHRAPITVFAGRISLYEWIRVHTPTTAIVIDNLPYVPVFAQRSLLVGRQFHRNAEHWSRRRDGWLFHPI